MFGGRCQGNRPMCTAPVRPNMGSTRTPSRQGGRMALIQVKLIEGVFTAPQKREIIQRLTDAMVEIEGENMRRTIWCVIEEVASGEWGIGGKKLTPAHGQGPARGQDPGRCGRGIERTPDYPS